MGRCGVAVAGDAAAVARVHRPAATLSLSHCGGGAPAPPQGAAAAAAAAIAIGCVLRGVALASKRQHHSHQQLQLQQLQQWPAMLHSLDALAGKISPGALDGNANRLPPQKGANNADNGANGNARQSQASPTE